MAPTDPKRKQAVKQNRWAEVVDINSLAGIAKLDSEVAFVACPQVFLQALNTEERHAIFEIYRVALERACSSLNREAGSAWNFCDSDFYENL